MSTPLSTGVAVVVMVGAPLIRPAPVPAGPNVACPSCSPPAARLQDGLQADARERAGMTTATSATVIDRFLDAVRTGRVSPDLYADDAQLDATVPGWRFQADGAGADRGGVQRLVRRPSTLESLERLPVDGGEVVRYLHTVRRRWAAARRPPRPPAAGARRPDRRRHRVLRRPLGAGGPRRDGPGGACWLTWRPASSPARRRRRSTSWSRAPPSAARSAAPTASPGSSLERVVIDGERFVVKHLHPDARLDHARLRRPRLPARRGVDLRAAGRRAADHRPRRGRGGRRSRAQRMGRRAPAARRQRAPRPRGRRAAVAGGPPAAARPPRRPVGRVLGRGGHARAAVAGEPVERVRPGWTGRRGGAGLARCRPPHRRRRLGSASPSERPPTSSRSSTRCAATSTRSCEAVRQTPLTFLHGDWKLGNLGVGAGSHACCSTGPTPGIGPIAHELAWYLALNRARLPESKEATIDALRGSLERRGIATDGWWETPGGAVPARRARAVRLGEGARRRRRAGLVVRAAREGRAGCDASADAYSATGAAWQRGPERVYQRLADVLVDASPVPLAGQRVADVRSNGDGHLGPRAGSGKRGGPRHDRSRPTGRWGAGALLTRAS